MVLAAGMGSRYGGLKQVDPVGPDGELIIDYSVFDARRAGFGKLVFVIRRDIASDFREAVGSRFESRMDVEYVFQEQEALPPGFSVPAGRTKPWGTGHAVLAGASAIDGPFAVINADDFYGQASYARLAQFFTTNGAGDAPRYGLVAFELRRTLSEHGHVSRGICTCDEAGLLKDVVEMTHSEKVGAAAQHCEPGGKVTPLSGDEPASMNMWGFDASIFGGLEALFSEFLSESIAIPKSEFYLPAAVDTLIRRGKATCRVLHTPEQWAGVTHREDRPAIVEFIAAQVAGRRYPAPLWGTS